MNTRLDAERMRVILALRRLRTFVDQVMYDLESGAPIPGPDTGQAISHTAVDVACGLAALRVFDQLAHEEKLARRAEAEESRTAIERVACPGCKAPKGVPCVRLVYVKGARNRLTRVHAQRREAVKALPCTPFTLSRSRSRTATRE